MAALRDSKRQIIRTADGKPVPEAAYAGDLPVTSNSKQKRAQTLQLLGIKTLPEELQDSVASQTDDTKRNES